jgi:hypothetical protein
MASSGVYSFNLTRDNIINAALRKIGILDPEGQVATATQITNAAETLNAIVKAWQNTGLQIWERKLVAVPLISGKGQYDLTTTSGDIAWQSNWQTTISVAAASGATTITVTTVTGMVSGMGIGIQLATGTWYWTTINGAPAGNVVTITAGLSGAANQYAKVIAGPACARPTRLLDGMLNQSNGSDMPIRIITKEEYLRFGAKTSTGTPVQVVYDPNINYGIFNTYPVINVAGYTLFLEALTLFEDFVNSTDNPDFPPEWLMALVWGLAYELAIEYQVTETRLGLLEKSRDKWLFDAEASSQEPSVLFQPDYYASSQYGM